MFHDATWETLEMFAQVGGHDSVEKMVKDEDDRDNEVDEDDELYAELGIGYDVPDNDDGASGFTVVGVVVALRGVLAFASPVIGSNVLIHPENANVWWFPLEREPLDGQLSTIHPRFAPEVCGSRDSCSRSCTKYHHTY